MQEKRYMISSYSEFYSSEEGQGLAEYALILLLIALAVFVALGFLGENLFLAFNKVAASFPLP